MDSSIIAYVDKAADRLGREYRKMIRRGNYIVLQFSDFI